MLGRRRAHRLPVVPPTAMFAQPSRVLSQLRLNFAQIAGAQNRLSDKSQVFNPRIIRIRCEQTPARHDVRPNLRLPNEFRAKDGHVSSREPGWPRSNPGTARRNRNRAKIGLRWMVAWIVRKSHWLQKNKTTRVNFEAGERCCGYLQSSERRREALAIFRKNVIFSKIIRVHSGVTRIAQVVFLQTTESTHRNDRLWRGNCG
jgi:hypothetical protein